MHHVDVQTDTPACRWDYGVQTDHADMKTTHLCKKSSIDVKFSQIQSNRPSDDFDTDITLIGTKHEEQPKDDEEKNRKKPRLE